MRRRTAKRAQILETAERLFTRYGAKRVSIEELCREAGVSKVTFYKYFPNKVELVRTIRDQLVDEGFAKFDEINALDLPFPEKIAMMTRWKAESVQRINASFIREMISNDDVKELFKRRYLANITAAQERGELRGDIDPEFLWLIQDKLGELIQDGSWRAVCDDLGDYTRQLRTLIFCGLLTRREEEG